MAETGAVSVRTAAGGVEITEFVRLLCKMAYGFLWQRSPESARNFKVVRRIFDPKFSDLKKPICYPFSDGKTLLHYNGVESGELRHGQTKKFAWAETFSDVKENRSVLHCQLSFLAPMNFPIYHLRIPNISQEAYPLKVYKLQFL